MIEITDRFQNPPRTGQFRHSVATVAVQFLFLALVSSPAHSACDTTVDTGHFYTSGWGLGDANLRYQTDTSIDQNNVARLRLKWAVSLGKLADHHSMPLVTEHTVFVGNQQGLLFALDKTTGCERFARQYDSDIRTAIVHQVIMDGDKAKVLLYFGTDKGSIYSVNAANGEVVWRVAADVHPYTRITGTPVVHDGIVYTPGSSTEAAVAAGPTYSCCTFRGSILALDAASGERVWRSYTIDEPARITGTHLFVINERGPSGAPVWSAPAIDPTRALLYYGTGENYSMPATQTSDAIVAVAIADGSRRWASQFTANDVWNVSCDLPFFSSNCPDAEGVDLDFGAPPILAVSSVHGDIVLAGQKSGMVYALNRDTGKPIWSQRVGRGGKLGGVHWGMAVIPPLNRLYVPVSDRAFGATHVDAKASPGLHALDIDTGEIAWSVIHEDTCGERQPCDSGLSAAILATPDLVFAGGLDGIIRAYGARTGEVLWSFDTWGSFDTAELDTAEGGAIDVHGPLVAGNMLFVTSGYGMFLQKSGNAFLAFELMEGE